MGRNVGLVNKIERFGQNQNMDEINKKNFILMKYLDFRGWYWKMWKQLSQFQHDSLDWMRAFKQRFHWKKNWCGSKCRMFWKGTPGNTWNLKVSIVKYMKTKEKKQANQI